MSESWLFVGFVDIEPTLPMAPMPASTSAPAFLKPSMFLLMRSSSVRSFSPRLLISAMWSFVSCTCTLPQAACIEAWREVSSIAAWVTERSASGTESDFFWRCACSATGLALSSA
jgi:hypothetical protein